MGLKLFNTLTRSVEEFLPLDAAQRKVGMYCCGPTVYDFGHIGNFRTFVFADVLRRHLEFRGYAVRHVMNITDVEDKIIARVGAAGTTLREYTSRYETAFFEDLDALACARPHETPRATEFIPSIIALIEKLIGRGLAYQASDKSVYFSIEKYRSAGCRYGQLANLNFDEMRVGERVRSDEYAKESVGDFALWKARVPEDGKVFWPSPWGEGRPGWHIECSAMSMDLLGASFDLHVGGEDLIFPHHEDEIAQSCAYTGKPDFARYWLHGEFLNIRGSKMSKRFGNITTPRDLRADGVDPGAIRLLVYQTHYRQKLDLTDEGLDAAREGARRLGEFAERLKTLRRAGGETAGNDRAAELGAELRRRVTAAMNDDLNAPQAVAALFDFVRDANRLMDETRTVDQALQSAWAWGEAVLDVAASVSRAAVTAGEHDGGELLLTPPSGGDTLEWAKGWARRRLAAKKSRNFKEADEIRDRLKQHGFEIRDTQLGTEVVRTVG